MTTSGSTNFTDDRNGIISDALTLLGVLGSGQTANANDITFCAKMLNKMIKAWESQGVHLWTETEAIIALRDGVNTYTLVNAAAGDRAGTNVVETTLSAAEASGQTILSLTDTTGMTASDVIGIELDDDTRQWQTISSVDSTTQVTINSALTGAAASGNTVITYTTKLDKPVNIIDIRYKYSDGIERQMIKMGHVEYMSLANKTAEGPCTSYNYSPQLTQGKLYVYPTPDNCGDRLKATVIRLIEDYDASTDNSDLPVAWLECLTLNLVLRVAPAFGISLSKTNPDLIQLANTSLAEMKSWDSEEGSLWIVPDNDDYY